MIRLSAAILLGFIFLIFAAKVTGTVFPTPQVTILHSEGAIDLMDLRMQRLFPLVQNLGSTPVAFHWSPDGRKLVYTLLDMNRYSIYMLDIYTRETQQIAERTLITSASAWSPDGQTLAMLSPEFDICL